MASLDQRVFDKGTASLLYVADIEICLRAYLPSVTKHCLKLTDFAWVVTCDDQAR